MSPPTSAKPCLTIQSRLALASTAATVLFACGANAATQVSPRTIATGALYRVRPAVSAAPFFDEIEIERVAPGALAMPAPIGPVPVGLSLRALTGQIYEVPERLRIYFAALDARDAVRLLEYDLGSRETRIIRPPPGRSVPSAVALLAPAHSNKLYIQWWAPGALTETDVYDGETLTWLGTTLDFRPDARALGFEHRSPYFWTIGPGERLALIDTRTDRLVRHLDTERWLGGQQGVVADAWGDLILFRIAVGGDRYQVVDIVSGEAGLPLDLPEYGRSVARLVFEGRLLVLLDVERGPPSPYGRRSTAVATGRGEIYALRGAGKVTDFKLVVPPNLPVSALGTTPDPGVPGRLWVHAPGDDQRFDLEVPACQRSAAGQRLAASLEVTWDPVRDAKSFGYELSVDPQSAGAAGAVAIEAARASQDVRGPAGWGADLIGGERWVRWMNGLGPSDEDVAPGASEDGFALVGTPDSRPGIAEYRLQAATGLPRGCESDDRFLKNSLRGYTIAPEKVTTDDPRKLAQRLERLVKQVCELGWIGPSPCEDLAAEASAATGRGDDRAAALDRFEESLRSASVPVNVALMLADASSAVRAELDP